MDIDRNKAFKLVIVILGTLAALAVMSTMVQLIQTVLPFLIVGAGIYVGYRWALSDAEAPTTDEMEEQARGWFDRFRRGKKAVETTMKVGEALSDAQGNAEAVQKTVDKVVKGNTGTAKAAAKQEPPATAEQSMDPDEAASQEQVKKIQQMKEKLKSEPVGEIEFKDSEVVISKDDIVQPDISRLQEKEKEAPTINDTVMAQIEERRRRLHGGQ